MANAELVSSAAKRKRLMWRAIMYFAICLFFIWTVFPLLIMVLSSFKELRDAFQIPVIGDWSGALKIFIFSPTFRHYIELFTEKNFLPFIINSLVAAGSASIISVALGSLAAYGLARGRIPGEKHLSFWILSTRMAPVVAVMVPLYSIFSGMGLLEAYRWRNLLCLIIAYTTFDLPFAVWFLRSFFEDIPTEMEEAAKVDGCSNIEAFWRVIVPMAMPGIIAALILCLIFSWNDFIFASIFGQQGAKTLPVATSELQTTVEIVWGGILASGTMLVIPMLFLGLLVKKYLVQGMTMGAVRQ
jgi:multiple sugar transport system permease protein